MIYQEQHCIEHRYHRIHLLYVFGIFTESLHNWDQVAWPQLTLITRVRRSTCHKSRSQASSSRWSAQLSFWLRSPSFRSWHQCQARNSWGKVRCLYGIPYLDCLTFRAPRLRSVQSKSICALKTFQNQSKILFLDLGWDDTSYSIGSYLFYQLRMEEIGKLDHLILQAHSSAPRWRWWSSPVCWRQGWDHRRWFLAELQLCHPTLIHSWGYT